MKILCLHGYRQNALVFRRKTAVLRKQLAAECVYVDAPHQADADERYWWNSVDDNGYKYMGAQASIDYLNQIWAIGEFSGILGFSQGALMACVFANQLKQQPFVVCVGGFVPRDPAFQDLSGLISLRMLHVIGESDDIVPKAASLGLVEKCSGMEYVQHKDIFGTSTVLIHPHGHVVPGEAQYRHAICDWITQCAKNEHEQSTQNSNL